MLLDIGKIIIQRFRSTNFLEGCLSFFLALSFWFFLATLPPFRIGIWVDSEFVLIAAHSVFSCIGLCLLILWGVKQNLFCSKQTLIFGFFSLICLIATLWARNPILHHLGAPMLGEGTVLFFGLFLLSFGFDNSSRNQFIYYSAILASVICGFLILFNHHSFGLKFKPDCSPYVFCAFLAPISASVFTLTTIARRKFEYILILFVSIFLLCISLSKTAWVAVAFILGLWMITRKLEKPYNVQKYLCLGVPFISLIAIYFLSNWKAFPSLESRKFYIQTYFFSWKDEPLRIFFGNGWGYYFENLQKQITSLPIKFFQNGLWKPDWDGVDRLDFSSMHFGAESVFCMGIFGLIFYLVLIKSLFDPYTYKKNPFTILLFVGCFSFLTSTWFVLMCVWPFFVLGFSILNKNKISIARAPLTIICLGLSTAICAHGALTYWKTATLYPSNKKTIFYNFTNTKVIDGQELLKTPYNYKGFHLGHFTINILRRSRDLPASVIKAELKPVFDVYNSKKSPLLLDVALLHAMQYFTGSENDKQKIWEDIADAILKKAPKRSDLVVPYVTQLIENNYLEKAGDFIEYMLNRNPNDPFAIWLNGNYHIHENDMEYGKALISKALEQNIENWICVPENIKIVMRNEKPLL